VNPKPTFAEAVAEAECDLILAELGSDRPEDHVREILEEHFAAVVPGDHTASGEPMRASDWFGLMGYSIDKYVRYLYVRLLRRTAGRVEAARATASDPDHAAALDKSLADLREHVDRLMKHNPGDP
jgi:hypothetical protein